MSEILFHYKRVDPTTWVYLSSLLMIGLFFTFNRLGRMRNLDLVLLILLAPGLLLVQHGRLQQAEVVKRVIAEGVPWENLEEAVGQSAAAGTAAAQGTAEGDGSNPAHETEQPEAASPTLPTTAPDAGDPPPGREAARDADLEELVPSAENRAQLLLRARYRYARAQRLELSGFLWLMCVGVGLVARLLIDPAMARRPLLEPNLNPAGMTFICASLFVFLMANVVTSEPKPPPTGEQLRVETVLRGQPVTDSVMHPARQGPEYVLLTLFPNIPTTPLAGSGSVRSEATLVNASKTLAILAHLAIVVGVIAIGHRHFVNVKMGIGAATLYLMLPYTHQLTGNIYHAIPGALLVWAVLCYRRPMLAGVFIGLAMGCFYYPLLLLPLWISFYWQRGLTQFLTGTLTMIAALVLLLVLKSADATEFMAHVRTMFGVWMPRMEGLQGVWGLGWHPWLRVPMLVLCASTSVAFAFWPAQKNLGTLLSCSGAVMVATQFWHGFGGGLYMGWYLPLLLLTVFRPNLEDRIALSVLGEGWFPRRRLAA